METPRQFRRLAMGILGLNLAVILWGAYVRASYSGDGCGQHWPTCNGELIPLGASVKTLVEFTHRLTAGFSMVAALLLVVASRRVFPRGHAARSASGYVLLFTLTEALVGAGLVLFRYVAHDDRAGRIWFMSAHLLNTFALLAAQARAIQATSGTSLRWRGHGMVGSLGLAGVAALAILAVTGALTALGDTLYPSTSLADGLRADWAGTSHLLVRLRVLHPALALVTVVLCSIGAALAAQRPAARTAAYALGSLLLVQLGVGLVNLALLAPIPLQLLHLLMADLIWLAQVWMSGAILSEPAGESIAVGSPLPQPQT